MTQHIADRIRCEADRTELALLSEHPDVVAARGRAEQTTRTRRSLLAQALRLTPEIMPKVCAMVAECRQKLGIETEVETFVYSSPQFNAACTDQEGERVFILLSSSLLEAFSEVELKFVIGHELGHHLYRHHEIPIGPLFADGGTSDRSLVVRLFRWQRFAEISADRAGLFCIGDFNGAASSFFKLSSGLTESPDRERIAAYVEQANELYREDSTLNTMEGNALSDWMSTHPFSPVRLRAAMAFAESEVFVPSGPTLTAVEESVHEFLELMEVNYLTDQSDAGAAMRHFFHVAALILVHADEVVTPAEVEAIRSVISEVSIGHQLDLEALHRSLSKRIEEIRSRVPGPRAAQLMRDLTLVAEADGQIDPTQDELLATWGSELGVPQHLLAEMRDGHKGIDWVR